MRTCLAFMILFFPLALKAQIEEPKFGKVEMSDLEMSRYDKDTSATALILFDSGDSRFILDNNNDFKFVFTRHCQYKIFKNSAFGLGDVTLRLYRSGQRSEKLTELKVVTYNLVDGRIVRNKIENSKIYKTDSEHYTTISFAFPDVREGSVLEFQYAVTSDFLYNFRGWSFQGDFPERWSQYTYQIPEYYQYRQSSKGYLPFDINRNEIGAVTYTLTVRGEIDRDFGAKSPKTTLETVRAACQNGVMAVRDVPAFKSEPNIDCEDNYLQAVEFELKSVQFPNTNPRDFTQTWETVNKQMTDDEDFGKVLESTGFIKDTVAAVCSGKATPAEKAVAIYNYVQKRMKWDESFSIWAVGGLKKAYNAKVGNSADINLLLAMMLQVAGLDASPVLFSTRDNGIAIYFFPTITKYNSVMTCLRIDDKTYLLDATNKYCPFGLLPARDINDKGRIISKNGGDWVSLDPPARYSSTSLYNLSIDGEGKFTGVIRSVYDGYAAMRLRAQIKAEKSTDDFIRKTQQKTRGLGITGYQIENLDDIYRQLKDSAAVEITDYSQVVGDRIMFSPFLFDALEKNIYTLPDRKYPVNYNYPVQEKYTYIYTVPEGYVIESLPSQSTVRNKDNSVNAACSFQAYGRSITVQFLFRVNKILFLPDEYAELRQVYDQIVKMQTAQVILKKG